MKRKINKNSCIVYTNDLNELHQEDDKPSFINFHGNIVFCKNGKYYRKGKPCKIWFDGSLSYWENNEIVKEIER